jgi:hypothetical protein
MQVTVSIKHYVWFERSGARQLKLRMIGIYRHAYTECSALLVVESQETGDIIAQPNLFT